MKLAKMFDHNFKNGNFRLYDSNNNKIYYESSEGFWYKKEYDENNNEIYHENSYGYWYKREFDSNNNNRIYYENSEGYWIKREYDENNNEIYYENSYGAIINNRPKCDKVVEIEGIKYKLVKI